MKDFYFDQDKNAVIENFGLSFTPTFEIWLSQKLRIRLSIFLGEYFLDTTLGLPYFEEILIKNPDLVLIESLIKEVISGTEGVESLDEFELELENSSRKLTVTFTVTSTQGEAVTEIVEVVI